MPQRRWLATILVDKEVLYRMCFSLLGSLVKGMRRRGRPRPFSRPLGSQCHAVTPTIEALEDRCLLSAVTTFPTPYSELPLVGLVDVFTASQPKVNSNIVFLGDSITYNFAYGPGEPIWSAISARANAADYGVDGQTTQTLLFQLVLGQLSGIHPSVVVLTIGTNNLLEGDSPQATAAGVLADANAIHLLQPQAQVLVLGVPPGEAEPSDPYRSKVSQTDALVSQQLSGDSWATFFNIAPAFEQANGAISPEIMSDGIHPTELGYFAMTLDLFSPISEAYQAATASHSTK